MAHGMEFINELDKNLFGDPQFALDALRVTTKQFLDPAFT